MKKRSAITALLAIPPLALSLVSCEVGKLVTEETPNLFPEVDLTNSEDAQKIQDEITKVEGQIKTIEEDVKAKEDALDARQRDLAGQNAKLATLEAQLTKVLTEGVTTGTHKSPSGEGNTPTTTPDSTPSSTDSTPEIATTETASTPPANEDMMDLKIDFPIPMFIGTPVPVQLPNLEKPGKPKLTMPVPKGSTNVAAGKPVTSSDPVPTIGDLEFITDGDKDGGDGYFVELGFGTHWAQIDLEKEYDIHAIVVWHFHKSACAYHDVIVQISNDPEFKEATTVYNNDHDNSSGLGVGADLAYIETNHGRIIDAKGTKGRYVRLYSNGNTANDLNHYIEVEVHATE